MNQQRPPSGWQPPQGQPAPQYTQPQQAPRAEPSKRKPWFARWWAIAIFAVLAIGVIANLANGDDDTAAPAPSVAASTPANDPTTAPEEREETVPDPEVTEEEEPAPEVTEEEEPAPASETPEAEPIDFEEPATTPEEVDDSDDLTLAQSNAIRTAENYLSFTSFSRSGLITQLEFEGYEAEDAEFAVDYIEVDWNEQAALKAESYLDFQSFSRQGLLDQLLFEGFTQEQAEYGVTAVGY